MRVLFAACALLLGASASAFDFTPPRSPVEDRAGALSAEENAALAQALVRFKETTGPQFQLLILPSLEGEALEDLSIKITDRWKLGDAKRDDGLLMLVALKERQIRIEVGQGLEGAIPDVIAGRVIREVITPYFKSGDLSGGVRAGLMVLAKRAGGSLEGVAAPQRVARRSGKRGLPIAFVLPIFILFLIFSRLGRRRSGLAALAGWGVGSGGWGGGRSGWGGGGGGGWGGGGGGFSGGGSSGSW